jgi:large subunit ribosomal protein L24
MKIKKNDIVVIISGKDSGKNGKVIKVFPKLDKILVDGIAMRKRHERPKKTGQKGQVITMPSPIHMSNAMLFCKHCNKTSRSRICKKCKQEI